MTQSKGKIYTAMYSTQDNFEKMEHPFYTKITEVKQIPFSIDIKNIEYGNYAIASFQDLNNNGVLDKNWFGYPTEPYGFSKVEHGFLPPGFSEASFRHSQKQTRIAVSF